MTQISEGSSKQPPLSNGAVIDLCSSETSTETKGHLWTPELSLCEADIRRRMERYADRHKQIHDSLQHVIDTSIRRHDIGKHDVYLVKLENMINATAMAFWEQYLCGVLKNSEPLSSSGTTTTTTTTTSSVTTPEVPGGEVQKELSKTETEKAKSIEEEQKARFSAMEEKVMATAKGMMDMDFAVEVEARDSIQTSTPPEQPSQAEPQFSYQNGKVAQPNPAKPMAVFTSGSSPSNNSEVIQSWRPIQAPAPAPAPATPAPTTPAALSHNSTPSMNYSLAISTVQSGHQLSPIRLQARLNNREQMNRSFRRFRELCQACGDNFPNIQSERVAFVRFINGKQVLNQVHNNRHVHLQVGMQAQRNQQAQQRLRNPQQLQLSGQQFCLEGIQSQQGQGQLPLQSQQFNQHQHLQQHQYLQNQQIHNQQLQGQVFQVQQAREAYMNRI